MASNSPIFISPKITDSDMLPNKEQEEAPYQFSYGQYIYDHRYIIIIVLLIVIIFIILWLILTKKEELPPRPPMTHQWATRADGAPIGDSNNVSATVQRHIYTQPAKEPVEAKEHEDIINEVSREELYSQACSAEDKSAHIVPNEAVMGHGGPNDENCGPAADNLTSNCEKSGESTPETYMAAWEGESSLGDPSACVAICKNGLKCRKRAVKDGKCQIHSSA
jgi:hypothetical protein